MRKSGRQRRIAINRKKAQRRTLSAIARMKKDPELKRRLSAVAVGCTLADTLRLKGDARLVIHAALQKMVREGKQFEDFVPAFCTMTLS